MDNLTTTISTHTISTLTVTSHTDEPLLDLPPLNDAQHAAVPPNQMLDHLLWPVIEGHHGLISQNTGTLTLSDEAVESVVSPLLSVQPITTFHTKLSDCSNKFSSNDNIEDVLPAEDRSLRCVEIIHTCISHISKNSIAGSNSQLSCIASLFMYFPRSVVVPERFSFVQTYVYT